MSKFARWTMAVLTLGCGVPGAPAPAAPSDDTAAERSVDGSDSLAWPDRIALERAFAEDHPAHQPRVQDGAPVLPTGGRSTLGEVARFDESGARVAVDGGAEVAIGLAAFGREGAMRELGPAPAATIVGPEVRIARAPGVLEWWRSLPSGLEQGVTIDERPAGEGALRLEMTAGGGSTLELASTDEVVLADASGEAVARYAHLVVLDAAGARVPALLAVAHGRIRIDVDDSAARYPLVVDPLVTTEEANLVATDAVMGDGFGTSVAISADGTRALVGAPNEDAAPPSGDAGNVKVFVRTGTIWTYETTLRPPDATGYDRFGTSVALSSDGSRALVGAPVHTTPRGTYQGYAYVFHRTGTTWAPEAPLLPTDGGSAESVGASVALSADGSRAIVGAPFATTAGVMYSGSARVFVRSVTTWTHETTLVPTGAATRDYFGWSVALSSDGSRALVGGTGDDTVVSVDAGSAAMFVRSGTTWVEEASLYASNGVPDDNFGHSVALSSDGSRALVGVRQDDTVAGGMDAGSARVFLRTGTTWAQEMSFEPGSPSFVFGGTVALSSDASRALITDAGGGPRIYERSGSAWAEEPNSLYGQNASLSSDGTRVVIGGTGAHVFTILRTNGTACGAGSACSSGFCVDGVCCNTACAGGTTDCQVCDTAGTVGSCTPLSAVTVCRASAGGCDPAENCTGSAPACPVDTLAPAATVCRAADVAAGCDVAERCSGTSAACPADGFVAAATVCRAAAGFCDIAETCTGTSAACPSDVIVAASTTCRPAALGGCDAAEVCDGVSVVCPGDAFSGAGVVCRSDMGACDVEERCPGGSPFCPTDVVVGPGLVCRPLASACDAAETCTGTSPLCPLDLFAPATTSCGPGVSGVCDAPDHCAGTSGDCVPTFQIDNICRVATGSCDVAEVCSGTSASCPTDVLVMAGLACGTGTGGTCSGPGLCNGTTGACPGATILAAGTVCAAAMPGNVCDLDDVCDGISGACPATYSVVTTSCGPAATDVCDAPDHCAGTSADCVAEYLSGVECRTAAGSCDVAEACAGSSPSCPPDLFLASGVSCRASTDTSCDPAETCDGVAVTCPADVISCTDAGTPDASVLVDAGPRSDAGAPDASSGVDAALSDAGSPPTAIASCACRAGAPSPLRVPALGLTIALGVVLARRRRSASARR